MDTSATSGYLRTLAQRGVSELYRRIHSHETERFEGVREEFLCLAVFLYEKRRCPQLSLHDADASIPEALPDGFGRRFQDIYGQRRKTFEESLARVGATTDDDLSAALLPPFEELIIRHLGRSSRPAVSHFLPPIVGDLAQRI